MGGGVTEDKIGIRLSSQRKETDSSRMTEVRVHAAFKAEQGCIHYQLYKEAGGESGSFAMIETWATQEDLTRHSKASHVKAFQEATRGNIEAKVQVFQPV